MPEERDIQEQPASRAEDLPLDTRLLSEAVIELNISRKNVSIYPPGHAQITRSIERAYEILLRLFEVRPEMTLGVAKDTLLVGQDYLDKKNSVYRDFALSLNNQGIAAVTFAAGLTRDELTRFHRVLTTKPEDIRTAGGIEKVIADSSITHIRIVAIDYGSLHVTEEQEIAGPMTKSGAAPGSDHLWHDFVSHLAAGTIAGREGRPLSEAEQIDPAELARLLNERKVDASGALRSYESIISSHIRTRTEQQRISPDQAKTLQSFNALLRGLHPDLRKQFLSVAFERIAENPLSGGSEDVLGGFSDDAVIDMLEQASHEGREISPTLTGLIGKLGRTRTEQQPDESGSGILPEQIQKLFNREKYEEYVSRDYDRMLKDLTESRPGTADWFPVEEYLKTLEDGHLDFQIGRALIAFLEEDLEEEDYREFAGKLMAIVPGFLQTGNFELLFDISETLKRHASGKPQAAIRSIAEESRKIFSDPEFIRSALAAFEVWMKDKGLEAGELIRSLGPDVIPGLLDILNRDASLGGRQLLLNLLCLFGEPAVNEAQKRLRDPRAQYVLNLLTFIRRAGTTATIPFVRPLLRHAEPSVRMEALSTLLKFKDPEAVKQLRETIRSEDPDLSARAVAMAGQYRISAATEDILSRIKRVILFEADYNVNIEIIKALGEIGDLRAVPDLEKLARASWSLYPHSLQRMKEALFDSLGRYPREQLQNLIRIGQSSNSDQIKKACRKLE